MSRAVTHDEARAALGAAALDALPEEERQAVLAHAAACAECGPELGALEDAAASLAWAAPPASPDPSRSAAVRARLLARAAADAETRRWGFAGNDPARWLAAAAIVALAATGALLLRTGRERDRLREALRAERTASLARANSADSLARILAALSGPEVAVVELTTTGPRAPSARMFWDRATNQWTMFAHHLPALPPGRTYQLWLVTRDAKISAGTFAPGAGGSAVVRAEYPLEPAALQAVAVTQEPAGGVPQPTGPVVLAGNASR